MMLEKHFEYPQYSQLFSVNIPDIGSVYTGPIMTDEYSSGEFRYDYYNTYHGDWSNIADYEYYEIIESHKFDLINNATYQEQIAVIPKSEHGIWAITSCKTHSSISLHGFVDQQAAFIFKLLTSDLPLRSV
jgi:hypothetical protein